MHCFIGGVVAALLGKDIFLLLLPFLVRWCHFWVPEQTERCLQHHLPWRRLTFCFGQRKRPFSPGLSLERSSSKYPSTQFELFKESFPAKTWHWPPSNWKAMFGFGFIGALFPKAHSLWRKCPRMSKNLFYWFSSFSENSGEFLGLKGFCESWSKWHNLYNATSKLKCFSSSNSQF